MKETLLGQIIKELSIEEDIRLELLSYGWILQLTKCGKIGHIIENRFSINSDSSDRIACDKYGTYEVLKSKQVPVIEHKILSIHIDKNIDLLGKEEWNEIVEYFKSNNKLVVKPNFGTRGIDVYLCSSIEQIKDSLINISSLERIAVLCPYYNIQTEYRTFYLDGECLLTYGKKKPFVVGDGINNIEKLIELSKLNIKINKIGKSNFKEVDLSYVPKNNETIELSWKHNLSSGAKPVILEKSELKSKIEEIAKEAAKAINIRFATIDIILSKDNKLYVLEINSGVCLNKFIENIDGGYEIAKGIYKKALQKMLD